MDYQEYKGIEVHKNNDHLDFCEEELERNGYFLLHDAIDEKLLNNLQGGVEHIWKDQLSVYGEDLLRKIGDYGVARAMFLHDSVFYEVLTLPIVTDILNKTVGETAILHLQNGICLYPTEKHNQGKFHKDFAKDFLASKLLSINIFFILDDFNSESGGTWLVPGSHQFLKMPSQEYIEKNKIQLIAKSGSILVFDSLLWHCAGENSSGAVRRAINHQYTKPFIKQQLDYPRMVEGRVEKEGLLAQRLGLWAVPPNGVGEYRVADPLLRTYRAGQG